MAKLKTAIVREKTINTMNVLLTNSLRAGVSIDRMLYSLESIKTLNKEGKENLYRSLTGTTNHSTEDKSKLIVLKYLFNIKDK